MGRATIYGHVLVLFKATSLDVSGNRYSKTAALCTDD